MKNHDFKINADVLLVESNPQQASEMLKMIEKHQITNSTFWLEDGRQAMDYLHGKGVFRERDKTINPRLIFLNINTTTRNGAAVLSEIRATPELENIPVVFMSSTEPEQYEVKKYDLNVDNFILKPLDSLELTNVMESISQPV